VTERQDAFGRTIQLFLVDGTPIGLRIASIHGWTGSVLVAAQSTFGKLLSRPEVNRTGIYILYGPDPNDTLSMRAYIGEADSVSERIAKSANDHGFWETAVVITTSDEALTKGHVRYLEARLIDMAKTSGRVALDNSQAPDAERRRLPEADRANMERFLEDLKVVLPVVGLDLLKPKPRVGSLNVTLDPVTANPVPYEATFEIRHKSGVKATAVIQDGEFYVMPGSQARKDTGHTGAHSYSELKRQLIERNVLSAGPEQEFYEFVAPWSFASPSAAAAVVLDRSSNGRTEWKLVGSKLTYAEWQEKNATAPEAGR
jgi:hypothetical protein